MKKMYMLFILFVLISTSVIFTGTTKSAEKEEFSMKSKTPAKALVVIYSYTGNTKAVADDIVKRFKADTVIVKAKEYDGFMGGTKASINAWNEVTITDIKPETVDMSQYNLIFLGSPIWWFRPAVPLWSFVEKNDFKEKRVILFNTFNSRFKSEYIDKFKKLVREKGGQFHDHIYVRRGRWYAQLNGEELLEKFNKILDEKEDEYSGIISQGHK